MKNYIERSNELVLTTVKSLESDEGAPGSRHSGKVNILLVDDHPENLLALEAVLQSPDYRLVRASSGEEALKWVLKEDFAVILLDVQMPGLNGFETARLIKTREKSKYISIIFITAINQTTEHMLKGYSLGAVDYIMKPFHPESLKLKVKEFVKIHENQEKIQRQSELKSQLELKEVNKKLERATSDLKKNEELAKVINETLLDTIVTFDAEGYILSVNPAAQGMFGYSMDELIGQHLSLLLPKAFFLPTDYIKKRTGKVLEELARRKDHSSFPVDLQIGEAQIEDERLFVCSIRDTTARKKLEEEQKNQYKLLEKLVEERTKELREANKKLQEEVEERQKIAEDLRASREHFYKVFQSSPCLIAIRSLENGAYIDVNESWLKYTGYKYEEVVGQTNDLPNVRANDGQIGESPVQLDTEEPISNMKIHYEMKTGEIRQGWLSTESFEIRGEKCALIVITDVTERVELENQVARLDRLYLIGEMAAGIAHEIRNPMTTVRGFLELSKSDPANLTPKFISLMIGELDRANSIITEFLNLAKNKVSHKKLQPLNSIIEMLHPLIQAEALRTGKTVLLELEDCAELYLDEKEISQLILNLSLNGLEAMKSGGTLTVKTYMEKEEVILEIEDEGKGIKPEHKDTIGTPFFTTKDTGTGLGLAICYSVAERHNAKLDFTTSEKGTTFHVRFSRAY